MPSRASGPFDLIARVHSHRPRLRGGAPRPTRSRLAVTPPQVAHPQGVLVANRGDEPRWHRGEEPAAGAALAAGAAHVRLA
jgi:hypothetical protein